FGTILLGPQLQALCWSYLGAIKMCYLDQKMMEVEEMLDNLQTEDSTDIVYDDVLCSSKMQDLTECFNITANDTVLSSSLNGAHLYQNKKSNTWISIWILHNISPNQHYQKGYIFP
ncbi:hypothetical protein EI94DRAFT_1515925, partial [Lactarius quietus]